MQKTLLFLSLTLLFPAAPLWCQKVVNIWPGTAPGSETWTQQEAEYMDNGERNIRNVVTPTLTVYPPESSAANGTAVIIAPGGGFRMLSFENEGTKVAEWLSARGYTAFVLKYRLADTGPTHEDFVKANLEWIIAELLAKNPDADTSLEGVMKALANGALSKVEPDGKEEVLEAVKIPVVAMAQEDGRQAIRFVRRNAEKYGVDPCKIGLMGFSAGGLVTLGALMEHDDESRPDFAAPIYAPLTEIRVPQDAPPVFLVAASDDALGLDMPSISIYKAWREAGRTAELHIYEKGGHGFGMKKQGIPVDTWIERFADWMKFKDF